ncbi:toll/interleukin-1 receptor domain-containing protein [Ideonella sp. 4Y11]|uniref:Toll/interleukin-1 receptor domain-containing protein n=1 Tax=Ideonella aquatica TaxID=2824119 RepID=A0A940YCV3_9BURK|nr:toll/interleukin-1 receptor domain-containing protein [Ideonella aquatica]MBQ0957830.1 toll/interleukin-1 receptor domain-containing protein [Ideonella aquatica]
MKPLFVSYTQSDLHWAQWVVWQLEAAGYSVRYQHRDFRSGGNFVTAMNQAILDAPATVALLSPAYQDSKHCEAEWSSALAGDTTNAAGRLIPVRVVDCVPKGLLGPLAYIDLVGTEDADAAQRLLAGVAASPAVQAAMGGPPLPVRPRRGPPLFPPQRVQRLATRLAVSGAGGMAVAVGVSQFLRRVMPLRMEGDDAAPWTAAGLCGLVAAAMVYGLWGWLAARRQAAASAAGQAS